MGEMVWVASKAKMNQRPPKEPQTNGDWPGVETVDLGAAGRVVSGAGATPRFGPGSRQEDLRGQIRQGPSVWS